MEALPNCTWGTVIHDLVKTVNDEQTHKYTNIIVGKNEEGKDITIGIIAENILLLHTSPDELSFQQLRNKFETLSSVFDKEKTKNQIDLGSGDLDKIFKGFKLLNSTNAAVQTEPDSKTKKEKALKLIKDWGNCYLPKGHPYVLITGGEDNYRAERFTDLKKSYNSEIPRIRLPLKQAGATRNEDGALPLKQGCNHFGGYLLLDMETKLTAASAYGYALRKLEVGKQMLLIPIGNYDAHFILFTKESNGVLTVNTQNVANFYQLMEPKISDEKFKETQEIFKTKFNIEADNIVEVMFAGSFQFGFPDNDNMSHEIRKGLSLDDLIKKTKDTITNQDEIITNQEAILAQNEKTVETIEQAKKTIEQAKKTKEKAKRTLDKAKVNKRFLTTLQKLFSTLWCNQFKNFTLGNRENFKTATAPKALEWLYNNSSHNTPQGGGSRKISSKKRNQRIRTRKSKKTRRTRKSKKTRRTRKSRRSRRSRRNIRK